MSTIINNTNGSVVASYGPFRHKESNIHRENENIRIGDLLDIVKVIAILATEPE